MDYVDIERVYLNESTMSTFTTIERVPLEIKEVP